MTGEVAGSLSFILYMYKIMYKIQQGPIGTTMDFFVRLLFGQGRPEVRARALIRALDEKLAIFTKRHGNCVNLKNAKIAELTRITKRANKTSVDDLAEIPAVKVLSSSIMYLDQHEKLLSVAISKIESVKFSVLDALTTQEFAAVLKEGIDVMQGMAIEDIDATISKSDVHQERLDMANDYETVIDERQTQIIENIGVSITDEILQRAGTIPVRNITKNPESENPIESA